MDPSPFAAFTTSNIDPLDIEAETYLKLKSDVISNQYDDVLSFWKAEESRFPTVARLARRILPITSSAASERVFSTLGLTVTPCRSSLLPSTVSNLINMKNLRKFKAEQDKKLA
uniref:HAT C-terminal dimerisation domain-containing protein n=1 Tax=Panagrolaimus superbus TaxID=310955 RepID=A0A914Z367_9BILA